MKININLLKPGVNRPQRWLDEHPQFVAMQEKLRLDIIENGMIDPLLVSGPCNDGYYCVEIGNQRLQCIVDNNLFDEGECIQRHQANRRFFKPSPDWDPDKVFAHLIPVIVHEEVIEDAYQDGYQ